MHKFRPSNLTKQNRTSFHYNEQQLIALIEKGLSDNSLRGFLYKRSSTNSKWRLKWFLLFENLLFYFDVGQEAQNYYHEQLASTDGYHGDEQTARSVAPIAGPGAGEQHQSVHRTISSLIRRGGQVKTGGQQRDISARQQLTGPPASRHRRDDNEAHDKDLGEAPRQSNLAAGRGEFVDNGNNSNEDDDYEAVGGELGATANNKTGEDDDNDNEDRPNNEQGRPDSRAASSGHLVATNHHRQGLAASSGLEQAAGPTRSTRERLSSDPQSSWLKERQRNLANNGNNRQNDNYSNHNHNNDNSANPPPHAARPRNSTSGHSVAGRSSSPLTGSGSKPKQKRTENSSSISGVSIGSHSFLAHNEQTIGRSTTTTAGKTPMRISRTSSNYSSLLNRRIGLIFLEGSYCERLVDSPVIDDLQRPASMMTMASAAGLAAAPAAVAAAASSTAPPTSSSSTINMNAGGPGGAPAGQSPHHQQHQHWAGATIAPNGGGSHANQHSLLSHLTGSCRSSVGELDIGDLIRVSDNTKSTSARLSSAKGTEADGQELLCTFTLKWKKEGSKEFQFRTETETECQTWVHAISKARYSSLVNEREQLEQKYLHLSQIVESESTAKWHYSRQCDELSDEIEKLRREICLLKRQENRSNHLRVVLAKSAALVETLLSKQQQQQQQQGSESPVGTKQAPQQGAPSDLPAHELRARSADCVRQQKAFRVSSASPATPEAMPAFQRARSMDQEQAWQEMAVRRARRCSQNFNLAGGLAQHRRYQRRRPPITCQLAAASFDVGALHSRSQTPLSTAATPPSVRPTTPSQGGAAAQQLHGKLGKQQRNIADLYQHNIKNLARSLEDRSFGCELNTVIEALNKGLLLSDCLLEMENSEELRKIKKVQSFFRGWLCRRRWKQIVQEYIKSPHAESMRKRNNLVFKMVECEEEYVEQLTLLIAAFLRPLKMAASSQRPALDHDELNSVFLNSETLLFLHQIFLKGLTARMESWPTLVLGDLFNMLLPMLTIYQEYVRNHHFSLQVLAECKQREQFSSILRRLEEKPQLNGRTLETFLTYPMHQIPRYIICLHEILAHTPHNHVERKSLYEAQTKLEELSRQMHDEVSETENIRQNLAIERMIIGGCDILLDVNQVFVRQGILLQVIDKDLGHHQKGVRARLSCSLGGVYRLGGGGGANNAAAAAGQQGDRALLFEHQDEQRGGLFNNYFSAITGHGSDGPARELVRQCFLFTNHLLLCTRTKDGKLRLLDHIGRISLAEVTLIESPADFLHHQEPLLEGAPHFASQAHSARAHEELERCAALAAAAAAAASNLDEDGLRRPGGATGMTAYHKRPSITSVHDKLIPSASVQTGTAASNQHLQAANLATGAQRNNRSRSLFSNFKSSNINNPPTRMAGASSVASVEARMDCDDLELVIGLDDSESHQVQQPKSGPSQKLSRQSKREQRQEQAQASRRKLGGPVEMASGVCSSGGGIGLLKRPAATSGAPSKPSGSFRSGLAGYLVNKLSNLTSLGGGGSPTSTPSSPATGGKRGARLGSASTAPSTPMKLASILTGGGGGSAQIATAAPANAPTSAPDKSWPPSANSAHFQSAGGNQSVAASIGVSFQAQPSSLFDQMMAAIARASKDYAGCDFILLLESSKCASLAAGAGSSGPGNSSSSGAGLASGGGSGSGGGGAVGAGQASAGSSSNLTAHEHHAAALGPAGWSGVLIIHLVAPNLQEKAAWMSDISQCIDNVHFNDLFHGTVNDSSSSITVNQSVRTDPRLHEDDVDIKFSRALNSCKLPQIRYASKERLFERLTDLRFLSIDFLNTFLLTYRVFTSAEDVIEALKSVHYNSDRYCNPASGAAAAPGQGQHRDSFSCYANSSVTNSSQNLHGSSGQLDDKQPHFCSSPKISPQLNVSANGQDERGPAGEHAPDKRPSPPSPLTKKPPMIPPRSPGCLIQANSSGQLDHNNNFLLTPSAGMLSQKRRSTISALTPITGSTASSLVNIAAKCSSSSREEEASFQEQRSIDKCQPVSYCVGAGGNSAADLRRAGQDASDIDEIHHQRASSIGSGHESEVRGLTLVCSSASSSSADMRQRSASMSMQSARVGGGGGGGRCAGSGRAQLTKGSTTPNHLTVPGRQVRASSLSHVATPTIVGTSASSSEHWRLSYKKSTARSRQDLQAAGNLLTPNYIAPGSAHLRRKSAADVDKIRLQVSDCTSNNADEAFDEASNDDVESRSLLGQHLPSVPPSTPIELEPASQSTLSASSLEMGVRNVADEQRARKVSGGALESRAPHQPARDDCLQNSTASSRYSSEEENRPKAETSKSDSDIVQTLSSSNEDLLQADERDSLAPQKRLSHDGPANEPAASLRKMNSTTRKRQLSFAMKEIDFTQSRMMDSDTSADESEEGSTDASFIDIDHRPREEAREAASGDKKGEIALTLTELKLADEKNGARAPQIPARDRPARSGADEAGPSTGRSDFSETAGNRMQKSASTMPASPSASTSQSRDTFAGGSGSTIQPVRRAQKPPGMSSSCMTTPRSSFQYSSGENPLMNSKAGVVVTSRSPRVSSRRSSTASAASAFAAATAASSNPLLTQPPLPMRQQMTRSPLGDISGGSTMSIDPSQCACAQLHRGSVASIVPQRREMLRSHHPSCVHSQYALNNPHSDATSLCNSRASSRLSSCAGLEFAYQHQHQQQAQQQQQQQQQQAGPSSSRQQQAFHPGGNLRSNCQSSALSLGSGHFGSNRYASQANIQSKRNSTIQQNNIQQNNVRSMATLRVLSVLRHWVSKHSQDFVNDSKLTSLTQEFLQDLIADTSLLPAEHKAAIQLQQMMQKASHSRGGRIDLDVLLAPPTKPSPDSIETLSALEIAEGMTYLDHKIFLAIKSEEFLGQAWMKSDKAIKAPHILLITKRFNDVSRLVSSEIIRVPELHRRVAVIEKWTNVAHICRVIHNFNGVLQICAAFTNSSVFRLKKTWDKIPKTTKATIDQLQNLVSTDSRFRNMRDAINRCDPPSIPYVGMYLTDLSFIEEGTPNYSPEGLLNFSKMRMIAHVIREIQHLQNGVYKMDLNPRVANYLLDASRHLQDDEMYRCSLAIEHR